jgi:hypothetical protein
VDPNVLISAAISPYGPPRSIFKHWLNGDFEMVVSYDLLYELEAVLLRKKFREKLSISDVLEYVRYIADNATMFDQEEPPLAGRGHTRPRRPLPREPGCRGVGAPTGFGGLRPTRDHAARVQRRAGGKGVDRQALRVCSPAPPSRRLMSMYAPLLAGTEALTSMR